MTRFRCLLACVAALTAQPLWAQGLPANLAFVPADAVGFVHVRLADVWKSGHFKEMRETVLKAGPKYLEAFDDRFAPKPSSLEAVTIVFAAPEDGVPFRPDDNIYAIVTTSEAIDMAAFRKNTLPGAKEMKTDAGTYLVDAKGSFGVHFLNNKTMVVSSSKGMSGVLSRPRAKKGSLSEALKLANAGKPIVLAFNPQALPPKERPPVPPPFQPLLKAQYGMFSLDFEGDGQLDVRIAFADADDASAAENAAKAALQMGRAFIDKTRKEMQAKVLGNGKPGSLEEFPEAAGAFYVVGLMNRLDSYLDSAPLTKNGNALAMTLKFPPGAKAYFDTYAIGIGLLVPAVQKVRSAASRTEAMNNLKQIGLALHSYHDTYKKFPSAAICDKAGKPLLSWRVAILPYIDQMALYQKFKLDEPWDSAHNKPLVDIMPTTYAIPGAPAAAGHTNYRVFVGGGAGFEWSKGLRFTDITDGTSNTIAVVEAADGVPWTKPEELVYDAKRPLPRLGDFHGGKMFQALLFDGSVRMISHSVPEATLRAFITRAAGDVPDEK